MLVRARDSNVKPVRGGAEADCPRRAADARCRRALWKAMGSRGSISTADTIPKGDPRALDARAGPANHPRATLFISLAHTLCDAGRTLEAEELCRWVLSEQPH